MIVYEITCLVNGKRYVGITARANLNLRFAEHVRDSIRYRKTTLHSAMAKHGVDNFRIEQIASMLPGASFDDLLEVERMIVADRGTIRPNGYNSTHGGDGTLGYRHTPEVIAFRKATNTGERNPWHGKRHDAATLARIAEASRAHWQDPDYRERVMAAKPKGRSPNLSDERRRAMSEKQRGEKNHMWGRPLTEERKRQNSESSKKMWKRRKAIGWAPSAETAAKISAANAGRKRSPEAIAKFSAAMKGRVFSAEHRANLKASIARGSILRASADPFGVAYVN